MHYSCIIIIIIHVITCIILFMSKNKTKSKTLVCLTMAALFLLGSSSNLQVVKTNKQNPVVIKPELSFFYRPSLHAFLAINNI